MAKLRVVVLMGGKSPEHEVSLASGREVVRNLDKRKYQVFPVVLAKKRTFFPQIIDCQPEVVFIALHGLLGEDGAIQGTLELAGIPYTGAGVLASALGMDKTMFRKIMMTEKIPIPEHFEISSAVKFPVVVKPSSQGSSIGVSIVRAKKDLAAALKKAFKFGPQVIVEKYLPGTEVTVGVLGNENPMALPVVEIVPKKEFFDYEAKYNEGMRDEIVPARISQNLTKQVQALALKVYRAIGCRGFGRVDMIIAQGKPYVLEINTIPGLTPVSLFPKEAAAAGITYSQLLDRLIELALEK